MRKSNLLGLVLMVLCVGFISCSKDDGENITSDDEICELTVNGNKINNYDYYASMSLVPIVFGNSEAEDTYTSTAIVPYNLKTTDYEILSINIIHHKEPSEFDKYNKVGSYRVGELTYPFSNKNFDLLVLMKSPTGKYALQSGGTHEVKLVKLLKKEASGDCTYMVQGIFSASYKNTTTNKTLTISGKYNIEPMTKVW